jgi:hypothetical protein
VTQSAALFGYSPSGPVLTLVLPLGLFVVVMIGMTIVFRPRQAVPARSKARDRVRPASAGAARSQPDSEDTEVHDTLVSDTDEGASAQDSAVSDRAGEDTPSAGTGEGDAAATGTPEAPE